MKNTHLEHPEDCILTGNLSVLDAFLLPLLITLKIDGAPAIVWGTNPETGNFFVGTKSVFNKVKIKINESHSDIEQNHDGQVADILHYCLDNLPDHDGIIQGDGLWHPADYFNRNWDCDTVFNSDAVDINGIRAICVDGSYADIGWQPYQPQCEGNTEPNCTFEHCEYDYNNFECVTKAGHAYMTVDYPPIPGVEKYTDYYFFNGHEACSAKAYNNEFVYLILDNKYHLFLLIQMHYYMLYLNH